MTETSEFPGLPFSDIALSPEAACLLGSALIRSDRFEAAVRLASALGEKMFPPASFKEFPASFFDFWRAAFESGDGIRVFQAAWPAPLPLPLAPALGRSLLILAARSGDAQSFDRLLSLKVARRSKSILLAAFENGGWRMAEKVKKPTESEAVELLLAFSKPVASGSEAESFRWALGFLEGPHYRFDAQWAFRSAKANGPEVGLAIAENLPRLGLDRLSPQNALAFAASFLSAGAFSAAERTLGTFGLSWSSRFADKAESTSFLASDPRYAGSTLGLFAPGLPLATAALFSNEVSVVLDAASAGSSLPSASDLKLIVGSGKWGSQAAPAIAKTLPEVLSVLEAAEIRLSLGTSPQPSRSKRLGI